MLRNINLVQRKPLVFMLVLSVIVVGLSEASCAATLVGQGHIDKSKTRALEVRNIKVVDDHAKISLQNVSRKNVNGIQMSVNGSIFQIEFLDADLSSHQVLLPGNVYEEWFLLVNPSDAVEVAVLAVAFDDNDGDGDASLVKEITDTRRGVKKQLMSFGSILKDVLSSTNADSTAALEILKSKVDDLPDEERGDSGAMKVGRRKAKQQLQNEIEGLRRLNLVVGSGQLRQALADLDKRHDRRITGLPS